jgi:hypothetical protein
MLISLMFLSLQSTAAGALLLHSRCIVCYRFFKPNEGKNPLLKY